jgi:hypothetical protein
MTSAPLFTASLKTGRGVLFIDLKQAKNGKQYLSLSEVYVDSKTGNKKRSTIQIFGKAVEYFKIKLAAFPIISEAHTHATTTEATTQII